MFPTLLIPMSWSKATLNFFLKRWPQRLVSSLLEFSIPSHIRSLLEKTLHHGNHTTSLVQRRSKYNPSITQPLINTSKTLLFLTCFLCQYIAPLLQHNLWRRVTIFCVLFANSTLIPKCRTCFSLASDLTRSEQSTIKEGTKTVRLSLARMVSWFGPRS